MKTRDKIAIAETPFVWTTNLTDDEIRDFYLLYRERISERNDAADTSKDGIVISLRIGFLPFQDGICLWQAFGAVHTVLYRSNRDWELWEARQKEIEELRQEQAVEELVEKELVMTEDAYLKAKTESAILAGDYDNAAAYITARAELRLEFKRFQAMPVIWSCWNVDMIFARFPTSRQGIEHFRRYNSLPQAFINFAHWFSVRCGLHGENLFKQTGAIYEEAMSLYPDHGGLSKAACLFFRRVKRYDLAVLICQDAIKKGLKDGTKSGFAGRMKRLELEASLSQSEC